MADEDGGGDENAKDGDGHDEKDDGEDAGRPTWVWWVAGGIALAFVVVLLLVILLPHAHVKTDDAYVTGHYAMVSPRVGGQVASVSVDDNQPVRRGQLLVTIDDRDYRNALAQAEASLAADRARIDQAGAQVVRQPAIILQAEAQVDAAAARVAFAAVDARRYANLARTGAGTVQQRQQADATLREEQAALAQAKAALIAQRRQLDSLRADRQAAVARVGQDEAAVAQARLNLSYTHIVAPIGGTVAEKTVQAGNNVAPGGPLLMIVPLDDVYITANYRELELRHMRPGQPARVHVDAYDIDLAGRVASIAPASGTTFSPIPPNNATGNFTKIVQRLPVKIVIDRRQPLARLLRAGMSVEVSVDTDLADIVALQQQTRARVTQP